MSKPRVIIPLFPGTNCHQEMAYAFKLAGAHPQIVPLYDLETRKVKLQDADLLGFAGGFSYADHFRSGAFASNDLLALLADQLQETLERRVPMLGICNGFQILVETGILPDGRLGQPSAILDRNLSARFVHLSEVRLCFKQSTKGECVWLQKLDGATFTLPVAHGEGRLVPQSSPNYNVVVTYGTPEGDVDYSPNGSPIAGICSDNGLILGMMPHPERRILPFLGGCQGLAIFQSGVSAVL